MILPFFEILLLGLYSVGNCRAHTQVLTETMPKPRGAEDHYTVDKKSSKIIKLRSDIEIKDGVELNWPISVTDNFHIMKVTVELRDFFHQDASDVRITLHHVTQSAVLVRPKSHQLDDYLHVDSKEPTFAYGTTATTRRTGLTYTFVDGVFTGNGINSTINIALGKNVSMSSTFNDGLQPKFVYSGAYATDGSVDGVIPNVNIARTKSAYSSDNVGPSDNLYSWMQVDLGSQVEIGSIVLWDKEEEPFLDVREVQQINIYNDFRDLQLEILDVNSPCWFTLAYNRSRNQGDRIYEESDKLSCNATEEQVQLAIENFTSLISVQVTRLYNTKTTPESSIPWHSGYSWNLKYMVPSGPSELIKVGRYSFGAHNSSLKIETKRIHQGRVTKRPFSPRDAVGAYVMIFRYEPKVEDLNSLLNTSIWHKRFNYGLQREMKFPVLNNITGRFVRIQLQVAEELVLSEIQVFPYSSNTIYDYHGGSPILAGTYTPADSLNHAFGGTSSQGDWILQIEDLQKQKIIYRGGESMYRHGTGGIHDWVISIYEKSGRKHTYYSGVLSSVDKMPACGKLYKIENGTMSEIVKRPGYQKSRRTTCENSVKEHVVAEQNFLSPNDLIVYVPNEDYTGPDYIDFSISIAGDTSPTQRVYFNVRKCRLNCMIEINDDYWTMQENNFSAVFANMSSLSPGHVRTDNFPTKFEIRNAISRQVARFSYAFAQLVRVVNFETETGYTLQ